MNEGLTLGCNLFPPLMIEIENKKQQYEGEWTERICPFYFLLYISISTILFSFPSFPSPRNNIEDQSNVLYICISNFGEATLAPKQKIRSLWHRYKCITKTSSRFELKTWLLWLPRAKNRVALLYNTFDWSSTLLRGDGNGNQWILKSIMYIWESEHA